ncbi:ANTAR domain-containing protein [Kineosporia babensis]|uniref:ANTAR domain-containing protein n=1 Tax=Kineosporia babensis TaxID=499548 RepID=A0A9X1NH48_9ACTN|nr:ANTAR domain-containing protein [Kineosporia babensis]MCD5313940.1 ANTAR domain-containing protein [Kineosporia babensis]
MSDNDSASEAGGNTAPSPLPTWNHLAQNLIRTSQLLHAGGEPEPTVRTIVEAAPRLVPGVQAASVISTRAIHQVGDLAAVPCWEEQGPASVILTGEAELLVLPDLADEGVKHRWPSFTRKAHELGFRGLMSLRLSTPTRNLGALSLYSRHESPFGEVEQQVSQLFAAQAAQAWAHAVHIQELHEALESRDVIGQAKGMLMQRLSIDAEEAFSVLSRLSMDTNIKLRQVAEQLVGSGLQAPARQSVPRD